MTSECAPADPYSTIAPFYDLGMQGFAEDIELYRQFARRTDQSVLELGCGSGRVAVALARAGHHLVGIDRSAAMLNLARLALAREPALPLALLRVDMRRFALGERFGLIVIALDAFLHLSNQADQIACLRCASQHLENDGQLVMDIAGPASPGWEDWSPGVRPQVLAWSTALPEGAWLNKYSSFSADASRQIHSVTEIYERLEPDGAIRRWQAEYDLRYVFPAELELLLAAAGLRLQSRYGDYDLSVFHAASPRQIVVAERE